jgi:hypothetical protein
MEKKFYTLALKGESHRKTKNAQNEKAVEA